MVSVLVCSRSIGQCIRIGKMLRQCRFLAITVNQPDMIGVVVTRFEPSLLLVAADMRRLPAPLTWDNVRQMPDGSAVPIVALQPANGSNDCSDSLPHDAVPFALPLSVERLRCTVSSLVGAPSEVR